MGAVVIVPFCCFFILLFSPESPVWYLVKGREEEAKEALKRLRGATNMDVVDAEFNRIMLNLKMEDKEKEMCSTGNDSRLKEYWKVCTDMAFLKPFGFLMVIFLLGMEWTGLPAIAFYMVTLLK